MHIMFSIYLSIYLSIFLFPFSFLVLGSLQTKPVQINSVDAMLMQDFSTHVDLSHGKIKAIEPGHRFLFVLD